MRINIIVTLFCVRGKIRDYFYNVSPIRPYRKINTQLCDYTTSDCLWCSTFFVEERIEAEGEVERGPALAGRPRLAAAGREPRVGPRVRPRVSPRVSPHVRPMPHVSVHRAQLARKQFAQRLRLSPAPRTARHYKFPHFGLTSLANTVHMYSFRQRHVLIIIKIVRGARLALGPREGGLDVAPDRREPFA